ncbi:GNAT family N-acetyltransferase [Myxococcus sp. AM009]|uniref:GNAT family N-acetyltransferase n=1 Tax=unclassified Myxococcus TaxID=2648731 RepID=UPI0015956B75|nr:MULTISPECIES: GNAT family N-acetyltransferase [unclassified Myxococcus]NVI97765.1 GNAT family N-acetyltransferase [Myxococcus sp. AM009]NVJ15845.1 GNAT family N-acetyltransferase [Myxococcus sp. AM010]
MPAAPPSDDILMEPVMRQHAAAFHALASDPAVSATTHLPSPFPPGHAEAWIDTAMGARAKGEAFHFAMLHPQDGFVGCCSLVALSPRARTAQLSYWVGRPYWGRGHATRAARWMLDFAFETLKLDRVRTCVLESNTASLRVLEKLGFEQVLRAPNRNPKFSLDDVLVFFERAPESDRRPDAPNP